AGHYDTARLERIRFVGANDGGSSTASLLELARVLAGRKNRLTYWVGFFDGEGALQQWSETDSLYGSRHMAEQLAADGRLKNLRALILVDMVGDRRLEVLRESNSTAWLSALVFTSFRPHAPAGVIQFFWILGPARAKMRWASCRGSPWEDWKNPFF